MTFENTIEIGNFFFLILRKKKFSSRPQITVLPLSSYINIVSPPYLWVPHLEIQPIVDENYSPKKLHCC